MKIPTRQDLEKLGVYKAIEYVQGLEPDFIQRPTRPTLRVHTSTAATEYAKELEEYELAQVEYETNSQIRGTQVREMYVILEDYLKDEAGLYTIVPKANQNKVWAYAWQQGHSSGYSEVYSYLVDLVELFES